MLFNTVFNPLLLLLDRINCVESTTRDTRVAADNVHFFKDYGLGLFLRSRHGCCQTGTARTNHNHIKRLVPFDLINGTDIKTGIFFGRPSRGQT